jgi:hypothetical protein
MQSNLPPLSFSARDLLARLVRTGATIRGDPTSATEPVWFCVDRCLKVALQVADVRELMQAGLIERQREQLYLASAEGRKAEGRSGAAADAARSATAY